VYLRPSTLGRHRARRSLRRAARTSCGPGGQLASDSCAGSRPTCQNLWPLMRWNVWRGDSSPGALFEERISGGYIEDGHGDLLADDIFCLDRAGGVSDADVAVARQMAATQAPWPEAVTIDTSGPAPAVAQPGPPGPADPVALQRALKAIRPPAARHT